MLDDIYDTAVVKLRKGKSVDDIRTWLNDMANSRKISWETASLVLVRIQETYGGEGNGHND